MTALKKTLLRAILIQPLLQMHEEAANIIHARQRALAEAVVDLQYVRRPEHRARNGRKSREKSLEDSRHYFWHLAEAIRFDAPELFLDYVNWAKILLAPLHIDLALQDNLIFMKNAIRTLLPGSIHDLAEQPLDSAIRAFPEMTSDPEPFVQPTAPHGQLARNWMNALLARDGRRIRSLIVHALEKGTEPGEIYDDVLVPCLREVGRLWQTGVINEAQEHYCSEKTNTLLSIITAQSHFDIPKKKKVVVGLCVANEQHSLGLRLALDCFELVGWDTVLLGANVPSNNLGWIISKWTPDVVAISVTMTYHLYAARETIATIRAAAAGPAKPWILVGGYPFHLNSTLSEKIGADMQIDSCKRAIELAEKLDVEQRINH